MTNIHALASVSLLAIAGSALSDSPKTIWSRPGHSGLVTAIGFSPDGSKVLTAGEDHMVKAWRASDGGPLGTIAVHYDGATCIRFSHNGSLLATGGIDREINVFRTTDLTRLYTTSVTGFVRDVAFSANDSVFAGALGYSSNELQTFRASDGMMMSITHDHWGTVWSCDYSNNGLWLASSGADSRTIVYSMPNSYLGDLGGHEDDVISVRFSPNSRFIASAGEWDHKVIIYSMPGGAMYRTLTAPSFFNCIAFSPDSGFIAAAGQDYPTNGRIIVWKVSNGAVVANYTQGTGLNVGCVAFSPDGTKLAYGLDNGTFGIATCPFLYNTSR